MKSDRQIAIELMIENGIDKKEWTKDSYEAFICSYQNTYTFANRRLKESFKELWRQIIMTLRGYYKWTKKW